MSTTSYVKLAESLPPRLMRFFARYPSPLIMQQAQKPINAAPATATDTLLPSLATTADESSTEQKLPYLNPFQPQKHPVTGRWHDPKYSLRRQAELVKIARQHGVEELLPFTVKGTEERIRRRMENGLRVKGTGVGQRVKGKEQERTLKGRLEKRKKAMIEMPQMIQTWKERGHGRGWRKWPK